MNFRFCIYQKIVKKANQKIRPYFTLFQALNLIKSWKKGDEKRQYFTLFRALDLMKSWKNVDVKIRSYFTLFQVLDLMKIWKMLMRKYTHISHSFKLFIVWNMSLFSHHFSNFHQVQSLKKADILAYFRISYFSRFHQVQSLRYSEIRSYFLITFF